MTAIIFAYAREFPEALKAVRKTYPAAEFVKLDTETAYFELLEDRWRRGQEFVLIEHDVVVRPGIVEDLADCPNPWCGYAYKIGRDFNAAFGCTKFSERLIRHTPDIWERVVSEAERIPFQAPGGPRHWFILDSRWAWLAETVYEVGAICTHWPAVPHLKRAYIPFGRTAYEDAATSPTSTVHHCWKGHVCRCIQHSEGHACPIRGNAGGTSGSWVHRAGVLTGEKA